MTSSSYYPDTFIELLNKLPDTRRQILFGDAKRFEKLFKEYGINDKVRYNGIFNKVFWR